MAFDLFIKLCLILLFVFVSLSEGQQCEYTNVEVTSEYGDESIMTVKTIKTSHQQCSSQHHQSPSPTFRTDMQKSRVLLPTLSFIFTDFIPGCEDLKNDIPVDLCNIGHVKLKVSSKSAPSEKSLQEYAAGIVEKGILPMPSDKANIDLQLAYSLVLLGVNRVDDAVYHLSMLLKDDPSCASVYYTRGLAYIAKGLKQPNIDQALSDFELATKLSPGRSNSLERSAEMYLILGLYPEALEKVTKAIKIEANSRLLFLSGSINFALDDLIGAEQDYRYAAELGTYRQVNTLYNLGLTLYHRGKIRNAIEVFREVLKMKPDYIDAVTTMAQAYKELGDYDKSVSLFNTSRQLVPGHLVTLQLLGALRYYSGQPQRALKSLEPCLKQDPENTVCLYLQGLTYTTQGKYYQAVKAHTKAIVYNKDPMLHVSSETLKAHYLREYSRYLHRKLDDPISELHMEEDLSADFRDFWVKGAQFDFKGTYTEQPGLQPQIPDVVPLEITSLDNMTISLLCTAKRLGQLGQVSADGFLPNTQHHLAMGLAAIQIGQYIQDLIKQDKRLEYGAWQDVFNIAIQYRRLSQPEDPVFWLHHMPQHYMKDGYTSQISFVKGHTINLRMLPYFDVIFRLVQKMVEHYHTEAAVGNSGFEEILHSSKSFEDLMQKAKYRQLNAKGIMVATQVPSLKDQGEARLDGVVLTLTGETPGKVEFYINQVSTPNRTTAYFAELHHHFLVLYREVKKNDTADVEAVVNKVLLLMYYFYNLMPLSRGTSSVAYTVALGMILAVGKEITNKIPQGKLLDMEAILAGAPEAFVMTTKQWFKLKNSDVPLSSLPKVSSVFPTMRSVIEVINSSPVC